MDTIDYLIVGGGIYGCATAWHLAQQGGDVLLLEKAQIASGASGGTGQRGVRANGRDIRELPLMKRAYEIWPQLGEELGAPNAYKRTGHLQLVERQRDMAAAQMRIAVQNQQGIETRWIGAAQLQEYEPNFTPQLLGSVYCPNDGVADHQNITRAYAAAAQQRNVEIQEGTTVATYHTTNNTITSITTTSGQRIAIRKKVLLLANSEVPNILNSHFATALPVWFQHLQIIVMPKVEGVQSHHLIGHAHRLLAIKTLTDGRIQVSGGWHGRWDEERKQSFPIEAEVQGNLDDARAMIPALKTVEPAIVDVSRCDSRCFDGIPIIDVVPGIQNALFATGWTGHGWAIAPAVSPMLAQWAIDGRLPEPLNPFRLSRFAG